MNTDRRLLFYWGIDDERLGIRLIGPARNLTEGYIEFPDGVEYFGVRFKPGTPLDFGETHTCELYGQVLDIRNDRLEHLIPQLKQKRALLEKLNSVKADIYRLVKPHHDTKTIMTYNVIDFLLNRQRAIAMNELAEYMGYTPYYLNKVFHAHTGYSIGQYQNLVRVHFLLNEYERMRYTIGKIDQSAIALETGYSDQAHMIREFKKYIGITPARYWRDFYSGMEKSF